jgi:flavin reductase (DIM6/NTAB) family NADH-FMN oxidoreductase RutF
MEKIRRLNLVNSVSGFKSANLIGTGDNFGNLNLAIFSSVIHLGSNPPLLGFIIRPTTVKRHTYDNIKNTRYYTINHIHEEIVEQAHQTSAKYPSGISEFEATGLNSESWMGYPAPFLKESFIKIGMKYEEEYEIKANGTRLIVGRIIELRFPEHILQKNGTLLLSKTGTVAISGLNSYYRTNRLIQLKYARP